MRFTIHHTTRKGPLVISAATMRTTFTAVLMCAALAFTGALAGCNTPLSTNASGSNQATTSDQELRESLPDRASLKDPRTFTGISTVPDMGDVVPVTDNAQPQLPVELTDADGYNVTVKDASRILALDLYGTYTKNLMGLGLQNNIVGRTVSSTEPALADLPVVTQGGHNINVEAVLQLSPSLVIVDHSIGPREAIDQIRDAGVTVVVMEPTRNIASIGDDIKNLGSVVGLPDEADKLAERSKKDLDADMEAVKKLAPDQPLRMAFLYARGNGGVFFILGEGTGAQDVIEGIGAVDVAAENGLKDAAPANAEALAKLNPDVFIMMTEGLKSTGGIEGLMQRPGVEQTTAGQHQRVVALPDGQSLAFGPQTGELLLRTAQAVYNPDQAQ